MTAHHGMPRARREMLRSAMVRATAASARRTAMSRSLSRARRSASARSKRASAWRRPSSKRPPVQIGTMTETPTATESGVKFW